MAATRQQRQKAAEVRRQGGSSEQAARAARVSVSTVKRWSKDTAFRAMVNSSPDIRPGLPPVEARSATPELPSGLRSRMWVTAGSDGSGEALGSFIPHEAYEDAGAVLHVHVVPAEEVEAVTVSIAALEYPDESPYIAIPLAGLHELARNLSLVCRLGSADQQVSLSAWLEVWTFVDEEGCTRTLAESLWPGQARFLEALVSHGHVVSIKSRKVGLSTLVCAHAAWTARIRDVNASVHLLSHREDAARELLRSLQRGFEGLPVFLQLPITRETSSVLAFAAGPGDTRNLKAFPATPNASIEATCSHLVVDEWAHAFDPEAIWSAAEPTLASRATSALITTAGSPGDFVHVYYLRSLRGETRHTPVFVSALERPDRSPAWLEQKRSQEGGWRSLRNYPTSVEDAFAAAGQPYFDAEILKAAQWDALAPSPGRSGDRCLKAWDIGKKRSVCVVLQVAAEDEPDVLHVRAYRRLVDEDYPTIQRQIETMHRQYPGPTVVEANSVGKPVIENIRLPEGELIEFTTTRASKQQMLTAIELYLQKRALKIPTEFEQLLAELGDYRDPEGSVVQDSVMALGIAVANADFACAGSSMRRRVLDLEPFTDEWYHWYAVRRLRSEVDLLNDNDARRGVIPPAERRARARASRRSLVTR